MKQRVFSFVVFLMAISLLGAPAFAKKDENICKPKAHKEHKAEIKKGHHGDMDKIGILFGDDRKSAIRAFLRDNYRGHCPPGLAKKHNGCMPPGQAKKYTIGGMLPHGHGPVPAGLMQILGPPPSGAYYAMVDRDVVLVSEASKKIIDAVTLLSAVR